MKPLHKDDIDIMDNIIKICLSDGIAEAEKLPSISTREKRRGEYNINRSDYQRYFQIIKEWHIANVLISIDQYTVKPIEVETKRFYNEGGFKKKYEEQQAEIDRQKKLIQKELNDATLSKWTKYTYWFTFGIAIAGFALALWAFIRTFQ